MRITRTLIACFIVVGFCSLASAADATYIGVDKCGKICHKVEYKSWGTLKHANAFDKLKGDETSNAECLKCHATGGSAEMPGVQCESCHGPGSAYKSMKVMKDHDAAIAAGLAIPNEATCVACHTGAPHDQKPFDFATMQEGGIHEKKNP